MTETAGIGILEEIRIKARVITKPRDLKIVADSEIAENLCSQKTQYVLIVGLKGISKVIVPR